MVPKAGLVLAQPAVTVTERPTAAMRHTAENRIEDVLRERIAEAG
jgi:hypothetical protein